MNIKELNKINFRRIGKNIKLSKNCIIYNPENILLGDNIRIDDFCILSGGKNGYINLQGFNHLGFGTKLFGMGGIMIEKYAGLSSDVKIYSGSDDYSGNFLTNPTVSELYPNLVHTILHPVRIGEHTIIGSNAVILPGCNICDNCSIGSLSLVNKPITKQGIYGGVPIKFLRDIEHNRISLAKKYIFEK